MTIHQAFYCFVVFPRTQAEMAHTCRGTINLATAHIDVEDACIIVLSDSGRTYYLKLSSEVERQCWVTALELAKSKAIRMMSNQSGSICVGCLIYVPHCYLIIMLTSNRFAQRYLCCIQCEFEIHRLNLHSSSLNSSDFTRLQLQPMCRGSAVGGRVVLRSGDLVKNCRC